MNNQQIIDEIKSKLTHDKTIDVQYLNTELVVFRTLKNDEVVMALEQLLFTYLSKEEKAEYDLKTHEILSVRFDLYQEAQDALSQNNPQKAKEILTDLVKTYEKIENVKTFNYYDFEQMIEYIIFSSSVENARKLNVKRYPEPITYYTYQLACICNDLNNQDEAIIYLNKALKFNPCSMYVIEELIRLYEKTKAFNKMYETIKYALSISYTKLQFQELFNDLKRYYSYISNKPLEHLCETISDIYKNNEDLKLIDSLNNIKLLEVNTTMSEKVTKAVCDFINYLSTINDVDGIKYLLTIMFEFTDDPKYQEQLKRYL